MLLLEQSHHYSPRPQALIWWSEIVTPVSHTPFTPFPNSLWVGIPATFGGERGCLGYAKQGYVGFPLEKIIRLMFFSYRPGTLRPTIYKWMEMVISNHFPCKDFESSNWNNHKKLVGLRVPRWDVLPSSSGQKKNDAPKKSAKSWAEITCKGYHWRKRLNDDPFARVTA